MANCLVYYDKGRATSWIGDAAGEVLANELERMGFNIVNAVELRRRMEDTVRKNEAGKYVVVFAKDVVPHDVFDVIDENNPFTKIEIGDESVKAPNIAKPPSSSLLMKFIYNGGVIVWFGDIPFWYVTNPKNGMDKLDSWFRNVVNPFTILGTIQIFTYPTISSPQPAINTLEDLELGVYPSQRPVLYSQDHVKDVKNMGDVKRIRGKCRGSELIPLVKTIVVIGVPNPWRISLPNGQVVDMLEILNRATKVTTVESTIRGGEIKAHFFAVSGTRSDEKGRQIIMETIPSKVPIYFEAYSSWIKCIGKGIFIRLWDYEIRLDKDGSATVTEEEVRGMARKIKDLLERLGIKCEGKPHHYQQLNGFIKSN
jgi:hypothetical protein